MIVIAVRYTDASTPDPELEAAYVQYGRYLTITGSRGWLHPSGNACLCFMADFSWRDGKATTVTVRSVGGTETELRAGKVRRKISLKPGTSVKIDLS